MAKKAAQTCAIQIVPDIKEDQPYHVAFSRQVFIGGAYKTQADLEFCKGAKNSTLYRKVGGRIWFLATDLLPYILTLEEIQ